MQLLTKTEATTLEYLLDNAQRDMCRTMMDGYFVWPFNQQSEAVSDMWELFYEIVDHSYMYGSRVNA